MSSIDLTKIPTPKALLSQEAVGQIKLMIENDYTLTSPHFRVQINGKGCDGFEYAAGFSHKRESDIEIQAEGVSLLLDPFSAYYLRSFSLDFIMKPEDDLEGFLVTNNHQEEYAGKFWREHPELVPPTV